jgi:hypothetical protein
MSELDYAAFWRERVLDESKFLQEAHDSLHAQPMLHAEVAEAEARARTQEKSPAIDLINAAYRSCDAAPTPRLEWEGLPSRKPWELRVSLARPHYPGPPRRERLTRPTLIPPPPPQPQRAVPAVRIDAATWTGEDVRAPSLRHGPALHVQEPDPVIPEPTVLEIQQPAPEWLDLWNKIYTRYMSEPAILRVSSH